MIEGRHIKVVGRSKHVDLLASVDRVRSTVEAIVTATAMRLLGDVRCYDVPIEISRIGVEPFEDEGGVTAIGVLSTSHCAIHTWPVRGVFVLDVYSCRDFEPLAVLDVLRERLTHDGASIELLTTDLSQALDMPEGWRKPLTP